MRPWVERWMEPPRQCHCHSESGRYIYTPCLGGCKKPESKRGCRRCGGLNVGAVTTTSISRPPSKLWNLSTYTLNRGTSWLSHHCSPHLCVGFLFWVLYPVVRSVSASALSRTTQSFTHNSFIHSFVTYNFFTHNSFTQFAHIQLSHTQLCYTQLFHTNYTHTHNFVTHTTRSHNLLTHNSCTHTHTSSHNLLTHTQLCHTHTQLFHTQLYTALSHTHNSFTHSFVWQAWRLWHWAGSGSSPVPPFLLVQNGKQVSTQLSFLQDRKNLEGCHAHMPLRSSTKTRGLFLSFQTGKEFLIRYSNTTRASAMVTTRYCCFDYAQLRASIG